MHHRDKGNCLLTLFLSEDICDFQNNNEFLIYLAHDSCSTSLMISDIGFANFSKLLSPFKQFYTVLKSKI